MYTVIVPFDPPLVSSLRYLNQQPGVNGTNRAGASYSTYGSVSRLPPVSFYAHTRDTATHGTRGRTKAHGPHRRTSQPSKPTNNTHPARQRDDRSRGRLNIRRPGADRSPRPTQKRARGRPQQTRPWTLPPPAPRAPPRACSKAVGEIKARAADCLPVPVKRHRGELPGHTRDTHGTDTRTAQTEPPQNQPTHRLARQTTPKPRQSTPKPRDARVATNRYRYRYPVSGSRVFGF
jgi:hypothetical protein